MTTKEMSMALILFLVVLANFFFYPRDGIWTSSVESFAPAEIVKNKYWSEAPVQVMNTFMTNGAYVVGAKGLSFTDRLKRSFGNERVDTSQGPLDVRDSLSEKEIQTLYNLRQELSYRSDFPCPHDDSLVCSIGVGWNRDRTKEPDIRMLILRIGDLDYLVWDDSLLNLEGGK
ncbi:MAG: hypothetical protein RIS51_484 [Actinomycetota bacterium]|jgi:hypothetical protein